MDQEVLLTEDDLVSMLAAVRLHKKPITLDFVNRTMTILSEPITNPNVMLSDGPMTYQNYLFQHCFYT